MVALVFFEIGAIISSKSPCELRKLSILVGVDVLLSGHILLQMFPKVLFNQLFDLCCSHAPQAYLLDLKASYPLFLTLLFSFVLVWWCHVTDTPPAKRHPPTQVSHECP